VTAIRQHDVFVKQVTRLLLLG